MPSWRDLKRFCEHDGWELYKDTDHFFYRKDDAHGSPRFTKVSKGTGEIKGELWQKILRKQLQVTKEYFIPANEMIFRWMREDFWHEARKVERGVLNRT